jgi:hypothetical protein
MPHVYNGIVILRRGDGYWNATAMCGANNRQWSHYLENKSTGEFLDALSGSLGIPRDLLIQSVVTGPNPLRGTWVHQRVAIDLARWCSPTFAVRVNEWIDQLLTTGRVELPQSSPLVRAWTDRIMPAFEIHKRHIFMNCPDGAWSILTAAVGETLLTEAELIRHCLPIEQHNLPDGSMGQMYGKYRDGKIWTRKRLSAPLLLPKWRQSDGADVVVEVAVYDADERRFFERWLGKCYFPLHLHSYLARKFSPRQYGLTTASAADNTSLRITGRRASLPPFVLRQIDPAGGFIPATAALGSPGAQRQLFDDPAQQSR